MSGRKYGTLPVARWRDPEWQKLTWDAQWLYTFLASQPHINPAGVFLMQIDKWAKTGCDGSIERIQAAGRILEEREFIAVDSDTGEGLLVSYIDDDDAHGNVFIGALRAATNTQSATLRYKLFTIIQELHDSDTGLPRVFTDKEQKEIEKLAATLEESSKTVRRLSEVSSKTRGGAGDEERGESDVPRVRQTSSDAGCLKCRQAQNLGSEARRGENPMLCGSCNFEAKSRRIAEEQNWGLV
jgi:hypothetical protein